MTSTAGCRRSSTAAKPARAPQARGHPRGRQALLVAGLGTRDAFDPDARASAPRPGRGPRARDRVTHAVLGGPPPRDRRATPPRSSRAPCSPPTATGVQDRGRRRRPPRPGSTRCSCPPHHDVGEAVEAAQRRRRGGQRGARPPEHAGQRHDADARWPSARASSRTAGRADVEVEGRARSRRAGWAPRGVARGTDEEPQLITLRYEGPAAGGPALGLSARP